MSSQSPSKRSLSRGKPVTGRVGIFWWWEGRLLAVATSISEGETASGVVDSKLAHAQTWRLLQDRHPELRALEYDTVPRGRVLHVRRNRVFRVLMDKRLFQPRTMTAIRRRFRLPKGKTTFETDPHYTTDPDELNRLFEEGCESGSPNARRRRDPEPDRA